jgi:hypothetical protein
MEESMKRNSGTCALLLVVLACSGWLPALAAEMAQSLDEVQVRGERLGSLKKAVAVKQDSFVALYNKLNDDKRQDVTCREDASTGTRLTKRRCSTRGQDEARQEEAAAYLNNAFETASLQSQERARREDRLSAGVGDGGKPLTDEERRMLLDDSTLPLAPNSGDSMVAKLETEKVTLEQNLQRLLAKYPELRKAQDEYLEARLRYETARRR